MGALNKEASNNISAVTGLQWGDEGKGKIVDLLSDRAEYTVRFQGGANAGHTVVVDGDKIVLHQVPSGIVHDDTKCLLGNGVVVNPETFLEEVQELKNWGIDIQGRLYISPNCQVVLPYHCTLDQKLDDLRGDKKIGTTGRGIGPCHADKVSYWGIRIADLMHPDSLREQISLNLKWKAPFLEKVLDTPAPDPEELTERLVTAGKKISQFVHPVDNLLLDAMQTDKPIVLEGAQGTLLDIDMGTYPYVTASNASAVGIYSGTGLPFGSVSRVITVGKAYCTRVGKGPFPTELTGEEGDTLREAGQEFGATTGRPRRCGWFDLIAARYACRVNGSSELALTKLDILSELDTIKVCTTYRVDDGEIEDFPAGVNQLEQVEPGYETLPGWNTDIRECRTFSALPKNARKYVQFLEDRLNIPITTIGVGPDREEIINRKHTPL